MESLPPSTNSDPSSSQKDAPVWRQLRDLRYAPMDLLDWAGRDEIPVDVEALADVLGIDVRDLPADHEALYAFRVQSSVVTVWVRQGVSLANRRFSIAQGIGHTMKEPFGEGAHRTFPIAPPYRYALELLMPTTTFNAVSRSESFKVPRIAEVFGVDANAVYSRFWSLAEDRAS